MLVDYEGQLKSFEMVRNPIDRFIFDNGHNLLLLSIILTSIAFIAGGRNIFGPRDTLRWYDFAIYLFVTLSGIIGFRVIRDFFRKVPLTFQELTQRNVIANLGTDAEISTRFIKFLAKFEKASNLNIAVYFLPVIFAAGIYALITSRLLPLPGEVGFPISASIINIISLLLPIMVSVYAICVFGWKCLMTGFYLHQFSTMFNFDLQPSHPDKTSGLKRHGDLVFSMTLILILASVASSILVVFADPFLYSLHTAILQIAPDPSVVVPPPFMAKTILTANIFLGGVLVLSLIMFIIPLLSTHQRMKKEKLGFADEMNSISNQIANLERQSRAIKAEYAKRNELLAEIESLTKTYAILARTPVWPFDRELLLKFITPQLASFLSLLGVVEPVIIFFTSLFKS